MDENNITKLDANKNSGIYKIKAIYNSIIYTRQSMDYLLKLYYLVF